jgi:hypothetical protein
MGTLGTVATAISRRLLDENQTAVTAVEVREAINEAVRKWQAKSFWFNRTEAPISIAQGDVFVSLPADYFTVVPRNPFTILFSGFTYQVKKYSAVRFDAIDSTSITGRPLRFTERDGYLEFSPAANQAYTGTLYYMRNYSALATDGSTDGATNDFITNAEMLIRSEALTQIHGELRQDEKMESRYADRTALEYAVLRTKTAMMYKTGTLTVESTGTEGDY